jgi:signal transduction histidine kinase
VELVALVHQRVADFQRSAPRHQLRLDAAVPALVGHWDPARLERVLDNLLSNAIKYSPDGGPITISVRTLVHDVTGAPWVELAVTDQGVGIPAADLPHIFERFHRGTNVAGRVGGAGIGLAGVQRIVDLHGGNVSAISTEGEGTTITVRLPLTDTEIEAEEGL